MSLVCALCACTRSGTRPSEEPFRRIQRYEGEVALASEQLRVEQDCARATELAERRVCEASGDLCQITGDLGEADADARCTQAKDACTTARERARVTCATNPPRDDGADLGR